MGLGCGIFFYLGGVEDGMGCGGCGRGNGWVWGVGSVENLKEKNRNY